MKIHAIFTLVVASVFAMAGANSIHGATTDRDLHLKGYEGFVKRWSGGALVLRQVGQFAAPEIVTVDGSGTILTSLPFAIKDAALTSIWDVAKGPGLSLAACGFSMDHEGRSGAFLAYISPESGQIRVVRTESYHPKQVAVDDDGSVWTSGLDAIDENHHTRVLGQAMMIRHFSPSGQFLSGFVPLQTIRKAANVDSPYNRLIVSKTGLTWFSPGEKRLIEISGNRVVKDMTGINMPGLSWSSQGSAVTGSGDVYLATSDTKSIYLWKFEEPANAFVEVPTNEKLGPLYGAEETRLVFAHPDDLSKIRLRETN